MDTFEAKQAIRSAIEHHRRRLTPDWVAEHSAQVIRRLEQQEVFQAAKFVHIYVSIGNEVETHACISSLLSRNRRVAVPRVALPERSLHHFEISDLSQLATGTFGIPEPDPGICRAVRVAELDLVIVPGIAFDRLGHRIGFGGGYYDGFLTQVSVPRIGLGYDFQIVEHIPQRAEDQRVDIVVTESVTYAAG